MRRRPQIVLQERNPENASSFAPPMLEREKVPQSEEKRHIHFTPEGIFSLHFSPAIPIRPFSMAPEAALPSDLKDRGLL